VPEVPSVPEVPAVGAAGNGAAADGATELAAGEEAPVAER
jgi:hypothetical protein